MKSLREHNESNTETIRFYDANAASFTQDTATADMTPLLETFAAELPVGATVLDWGCGTGRDSRVLLDDGFKVVSTDASQALCDVARSMFNVDVRCETFFELDARGQFDGIWASASLLHLPKQELSQAIQIAHTALKDDSVFYCSFKYGSDEGFRNERYFTDLDETALRELLEPCFDIKRIWTTDDVRAEKKPTMAKLLGD